MAYIQATEKNAYDITCRIAGLDTNYSYDDRYVQWWYNNQWKGTSYISAHASAGGSLRATGLIPNTTYNIDADIYASSGLIVSLSGTATTAPADIEPWEWYTPKDTNEDMLTPVTRQEWLDFCDKINEVRVANGLSEYSFTTSTAYISAGKPFPAFIFLQAADAINDMGGIAPQLLDVKPMSEDPWGDSSKIFPWYWSNLKSALNNAIP